jgi:hypothetical protein
VKRKSVKGLLRELAKIEKIGREASKVRLRFAEELLKFLETGGYEKAGYASGWAYLEAEICTALGWSRAKVSKLLTAAREYPLVIALHEGTSPGPSIIAMATLHTERRRQEKHEGRVSPKEFKRLERLVANGLSTRELDAALAPA